MRRIDYIVLHCADTPASMDIGAEEIRKWHIDKGWVDVGYHYIIRRNGVVETGRSEDIAGAHVKGFNAHSIGVCMVGGKPLCNFTAAQWQSAHLLVEALLEKYPQAEVLGHRDFPNVAKLCPTFDAKAWWASEQGGRIELDGGGI